MWLLISIPHVVTYLMRWGIFSRPVLEFSGGTALDPLQAFKLGYGPFRSLPSLTMLCMVYRDLRSEFREFLRNLIEGVGVFGGLDKWFRCEVTVLDVLEFSSYGEAIELARSIHDVDLVLCTVPDEFTVQFSDDPYIPLKQVIASHGIPSQMVTHSTVKYLRSRGVVLANVAVGVFAKCGGIPWAVRSGLYGDLYIGFDVGGGVVSTVVYDRSSGCTEWFCRRSSLERIAPEVGDLVAEVLQDRYRGGLVVIHRDGPYHFTEVHSLRKVLRDLGIDRYVMVSVMKSVPIRLLNLMGGRTQQPWRGTWIRLGSSRVVVATLGIPDAEVTHLGATPRPVVVEVVEPWSWEDVDVVALSRDVYWLAQLHWGTCILRTKLPNTVLYPHRVTTFAKLGLGDVAIESRKLWFL